MPEPTTVWMVQLERTTDDVEGTLVLEDDAIRFAGADGYERRIACVDVRRVKRVMGSPVLIVHSNEDGARRVTAFYFRKPPPLHPPEQPRDQPPTLIGPFNKEKVPSKRKQRRLNAGYLATASADAGDHVREWHRAVKAAVAASGR